MYYVIKNVVTFGFVFFSVDCRFETVSKKYGSLERIYFLYIYSISVDFVFIMIFGANNFVVGL